MAVKNLLIDRISDKQKELQRRLEIKELAAQTGVSRQAIYNWLQGDVKAYYSDVIEAFCKYFNCSVAELIVYTPDEPEVAEPA
jgi:putative transcriptional regulator